MESTIKQNRLKSFIAGFHWKPAPKPEPETVESLFSKNNRLENDELKAAYYSNHEMWRTCNSCGTHFDMRKERCMSCPKCGSVDLRIGQ